MKNRFAAYLLAGFLVSIAGLWLVLTALHIHLPGQWLVGSVGVVLTGTGFWILSKACKHDPFLIP